MRKQIALYRIGTWVAKNAVDASRTCRAGRDLLLRKAPRLLDRESLQALGFGDEPKIPPVELRVPWTIPFSRSKGLLELRKDLHWCPHDLRDL